MTAFYSPSKNAFYPDELHDSYASAGTLPGDLVQVDDATFQEFALAPAPVGMIRAAGVSGAPQWVAAPEPSSTDLANQVRTQRDRMVVACDWVVQRHREQTDAGSATTLTTAQYQAWLTYRQALRDITKQIGFPQTVTMPVAPAEASAPQP